MEKKTVYEWVKATNRVPTITKWTVVRQGNWAGTCYTDSEQSIQNMCKREVLLFIEDIEWLEGKSVYVLTEEELERMWIAAKARSEYEKQPDWEKNKFEDSLFPDFKNYINDNNDGI